MTTFQTTISVVPGSMQVADIPNEIALGWLKDHGKRCCYQLDGGQLYHAALLPRAIAGITTGSSVTVTLTPDTSDFQCEMPDELAEVLATDPEAYEVFQSLTPGRQRSLIYLVTAVKSTDKRIERALRVARALQIGQTDPRKILK